MRCIVCENSSLRIVCESCVRRFFTPEIRRRTIGTLEVVSLYAYETIEPLLLTKHQYHGYRIYRFLGKHIVAPFIEKIVRRDSEPIRLIGIDERVERGYSHIAALTSGLRMRGVEVLHGALRTRSKVRYAGKSLAYRLSHPRRFVYRGPTNIEAILIDDIVTTGTTLQEARTVLNEAGVEVWFALTLADANATTS